MYNQKLLLSVSTLGIFPLPICPVDRCQKLMGNVIAVPRTNDKGKSSNGDTSCGDNCLQITFLFMLHLQDKKQRENSPMGGNSEK